MIFNQLKPVGLGLRSDFLQDLLLQDKQVVDFLEIAPENWMKVGGLRAKQLQQIKEKYPIIAHGLNLSIGGPTPIDDEFLEMLFQFFNEYNIDCYSEHLSYCQDEQGYFHDLLPIPFTDEAVDYVSHRISYVQHKLNRQIAFENSSYYVAPGQQISELDFINSIITKSDSLLLLDVNNVYVNSVNHQYDPYVFVKNLPSDRIAYIHIAGHLQKEPHLIIDTHGAKVIDNVWKLLAYTYEIHGVKPTLLERDADIPPINDLLLETNKIKQIQEAGSFFK